MLPHVARSGQCVASKTSTANGRCSARPKLLCGSQQNVAEMLGSDLIGPGVLACNWQELLDRPRIGLIRHSHVCRASSEPEFTPGVSAAGGLSRGRQGQEPDARQLVALAARQIERLREVLRDEVLPDGRAA